MEIKTLRTRLGRCADYLSRTKRTRDMDAYYSQVCRDAQEALKAIEAADDGLTRAQIRHGARWPR